MFEQFMLESGKYARITIPHVCFIALRPVGSRSGSSGDVLTLGLAARQMLLHEKKVRDPYIRKYPSYSPQNN